VLHPLEFSTVRILTSSSGPSFASNVGLCKSVQAAFFATMPWLHERRGETGRNRKQGWAEFFSPPRRSKDSGCPKLRHPAVKGFCLAIFFTLTTFVFWISDMYRHNIS
jgi:hypothetical protein